ETGVNLDAVGTFDDDVNPELTRLRHVRGVRGVRGIRGVRGVRGVPAGAWMQREAHHSRRGPQEALFAQAREQLFFDDGAQGQLERPGRGRKICGAAIAEGGARQELTDEEGLDDPLSSLSATFQAELEGMHANAELADAPERRLSLRNCV